MAATACDTSATDLWDLSATGSPSGGYIRRAASTVISATERQRVELALLSSGSAAARRVSLSLALLYTETGCAPRDRACQWRSSCRSCAARVPSGTRLELQSTRIEQLWAGR